MGRGVVKPRRIRPRCGRGHIDVLPSGAFRAEIMVNRERARATYPTEEEAQVFLERQVKNASAYGIGLDKSRVGVNQVAEWFMDEKRSQNLKATTLQDYQGSVDRFVAEWGTLPVQRLTAAHITKLLAKLARDGLSPKTRRNIYSTLRQMLAFAVNQNVTDRNEADRTKPPKIERQPPRAWSRDQLRAFLAAVEGDRLEALWQVLACTGGCAWARSLPCSGPTDGAQVTVSRRIVRLNGGLDVDRPKSRAGSRVVGLTDDAVTALRKWQHRQRLERAAARSRWEEGGWIFTTYRGNRRGGYVVGRPVEPRAIQRMFADHIDGAGLGHISVHGLRHTVATLALSNNANVRDVADLLGHSQPSVTLNTYWQSVPGGAKRVAGMQLLLSAPADVTSTAG